MKQSIIAAYLGIFITFAMSFLADRPDKAAPESPTPASAALSVQAERGASEGDMPSPAPLVSAAAEPAPERISVKHAGEVYDVLLEDYLLGVLAAEMPADFEREALKAQAVAARTYTLYCAASGKHTDAMVCTDYACCQAWKNDEQMREGWGGAYEKYRDKLSAAVRDTAGQHLVYAGQPVFAAFHSSSAGYTESCGAIWSELPYLVSVESPEGEAEVPGYTSSLELSPLDFRDTLLHVCPEADFSGEESTWIEEIFLEDSGRVDSVTLGGQSFSGTKLRELFALRSTAFGLEYTGASFLFTVTGFGHGVGMSQYGANVMAQEGADYTAILAHYYPGTSLVS